MSTSTFDRLSERFTRALAGFSSRRSFVSRLGAALVVAPVLPLLPVARSAPAPANPAAGVTDFERYRVDPTQELAPDFFVPDGIPAPPGVKVSSVGLR